ncbi:MAG: hypothetical protein ABSD62_15075 [Candidatus Limnocylindrales bacterium]|jgi:hypothetical protein
MDIHASMFPEKIGVREGYSSDSTYQVVIKMDETSAIHLTIGQARGLWHELGAVLQSEDHDVKWGKHAADGPVTYSD